jgi:hypothetical protein
MEPIDDVRAISRIAYGFAASKALFVALEHDLFGKLDGGPMGLGAPAATGCGRRRCGRCWSRWWHWGCWCGR